MTSFVYFQLLVTLRYLAKGDFFSETGDLHGVSRSSVSRHVWQVVNSINERLENIKFPTSSADISNVKRGFYKVAGLPNCVGAVDGTLIPIIAPAGLEEPAFVCRKGYHALNVQAVVDHNMRFTDVVARWPGSTHDATIFHMCGLRQHLEDNNLGWLLGDSGYPLRPHLMTPKINPGSVKEERYNKAHSQTRMVVERAFGMLKSRFRCLHKTGGCLPFTPEKSARIVSVCCKLHNVCLERNIPLIGDILIDDTLINDDVVTISQSIQTGINARATLIDLF